MEPEMIESEETVYALERKPRLGYEGDGNDGNQSDMEESRKKEISPPKFLRCADIEDLTEQEIGEKMDEMSEVVRTVHTQILDINATVESMTNRRYYGMVLLITGILVAYLRPLIVGEARVEPEVSQGSLGWWESFLKTMPWN